MARAELSFRAAAAHGCKPGEAGLFWAIFGLMSSAERSAFTGRPGVSSRMQRPLREYEDAAAARHVALLGDLLAWAKVQSTARSAVDSDRTSNLRHEEAGSRLRRAGPSDI